jgi:transposase
MTSNEKTLNYKIIDLVESYNFHIKFTSIRVHAKKLQFFERKLKIEIWI